MQYVIGIDAGGSTTRGCLAALDGTIWGTAKAGPGNLQAYGVDGLVSKIIEVTGTLTANLPQGDHRVLHMEIGAAGLDRPGESERLIAALKEKDGRALAYGAQADSLIALFAGTMGKPGLIVIAGTGSIVDGINSSGRRHRVGGWGYLLGDEGSGYDIGRSALRAVARSADGRTRPTSLTPGVLAHFQVSTPQELIPIIYRQPLLPADVAKLAPIVGAEAAKGDQAAKGILTNAAQELSLSLQAAANALELHTQALDVFYAGGLFELGEVLIDPLREMAQAHLPLASIGPLPLPPVVGAVSKALFALDQLGQRQMANLTTSATELGLVKR